MLPRRPLSEATLGPSRARTFTSRARARHVRTAVDAVPDGGCRADPQPRRRTRPAPCAPRP